MPAADRCGEGKGHSPAFFLLSQPCIVLSPGTKGLPLGQGPQSNSDTGQGSGTKCSSTLTAQDQPAEVRMQSLPLGSRSRFTCLSRQVQGSKDTDHGPEWGLQRSGKGLPLSAEKSLRPKKVTVAMTMGTYLTGTSILPTVEYRLRRTRHPIPGHTARVGDTVDRHGWEVRTSGDG